MTFSLEEQICRFSYWSRSPLHQESIPRSLCHMNLLQCTSTYIPRSMLYIFRKILKYQVNITVIIATIWLFLAEGANR